MASPNKKAYLLRLHPEVYEAISRWADDEFRSVNAHMEYVLLEGLRRAGRKPVIKGRKAKSKPAKDNTPSSKSPPDKDS